MFNNKTKTFLILTVLFIAILGVSAATAADITDNATDTTITATNTQETDTVSTTTDTSQVSTKNAQINKKTQETVKSDGESTFTDLEKDIAGSDVKLTKDYKQGEDETNITLTTDKVIDGDGHTITATKGIFNINQGVTLTLKNLLVSSSHGPTYSNYWWDLYNKGTLKVNNVTFKYNSEERTYGGEIWTGANTNLTVTDSVFDGEHTVRSQIYADGENYNITVQNSLFTNYNASNGAIGLNKAGNITVLNSNFTNSLESSFGAGLYLSNSGIIATVSNCLFENLTANYRGGAVYSQAQLALLQNNIFKNISQKNPTFNAGIIWHDNSNGFLYLENNPAENIQANDADIVINSGYLYTPLIITAENVTADQESETTITYKFTDDSGNTIKIANLVSGFTINDETYTFDTVANGTATKTFDASFEPGTYPITLQYSTDKLLSGATVPEEVTLTVNDVGLLHYADIQALIDNAFNGQTITVTGPVYRGSDEEKISLTKTITLDFDGNFLNAKNGRVFEVTDGVVTIKNALITNVGNTNTLTTNVEGRLAYVNDAELDLENITFINNTAPSLGSSATGSFILALTEDSSVYLDDCTVVNSSGTFINSYDANVYIDHSIFKDNNLTLSYSTTYNALIANGGYLEVSNSEFINNTANFAIIDGQSQTLPSALGFTPLIKDQFDEDPMLIDNVTFINNTASTKAGAIHSKADTKITNSKFIYNQQTSYYNDGGAITSEDGLLDIDSCIFVNNTARVTSYSANEGSAIYNQEGSLNIRNSIIISNTSVSAVYNDAEEYEELVANGNYWGSNSPDGRYKTGLDGDDVEIEDWVVLNLTVSSLADEILYQDTINVIATFKGTDGEEIFDLTTKLPDYEFITFESEDGTFETTEVNVTDGTATTSFTVKNSPFKIVAKYPNSEAVYIGEAKMPEPEVYVLNDGNWTEYFNDDGSIREDVVIPGSELRFEGVFNNRDMFINMPLNITTADTQAVLFNSTFTITASNVNVTKIVINNTDSEDAVITVDGAIGVRVENNTLSIANNEDKTLTTAILVDGAENTLIKDNVITTVGPEDNIGYASDSSISTLYTASIRSNAGNLVIDGNIITTKKNDGKAENLGTIYGLYIYGKDNATRINDIQIINNEINTDGEVYEYGVKVHFANNVLVENNTVTSTGKHYTSGIHAVAIGQSVINNNTVSSTGTNQGYGIVLEGATVKGSYYLANPEYINVTNNTINVDSANAWGVETYAGNHNNIQYNDITVNTNQGMGVGLTDQYSNVSYNNITVTATMDDALAVNYDRVDPYTTGIKLTTNYYQSVTYNNVTNNRVIVKAPVDTITAVNSTVPRQTITDNFLVSPVGKGNDAVVNTGSYVTVENNIPGTVILTDENYYDFFDGMTLLPEYNYYTLEAHGEFTEHLLFMFEDVEVTFTTDGTAVFIGDETLEVSGPYFMTNENAKVVFDGLKIKTYDPTVFVLESEGNVINNTIIDVDADFVVQTIQVHADNNTIANTVINVTMPSADVDYTGVVGLSQTTVIQLLSSDNLVDNVTVILDATEAAEGSSFPSAEAITITSPDAQTIIENNKIINSNITVTGSNFVYGINVGRSKDTQILNNTVTVNSANYADAIQFFDANNVELTGTLNANGTNTAYGIYGTGMGIGSSQNMNLHDLTINAVSEDNAEGIYIEGTTDVTIADSVIAAEGKTASVIDSHIDWTGVAPTNYTISNITGSITADEGSDLIYFGAANNITIKDSTFTSTNKSSIRFNNVTDAQLINTNITNSSIITVNNTNLLADQLNIDNTNQEAVIFESENNILNNSEIKVNSDEKIYAVQSLENNNIIANTNIDLTVPSADVEYNADYSTKAQASTGILVSSDNNLIENVTLTIDSPETIGYFPSINGIHIGSVDGTITNNTVRDTKVTIKAKGDKAYAYGINVGNAQDTVLENIEVNVESDYYADAIQLFDADGLEASGSLTATAKSQAYGVYSTAMGTGQSQNINLTGLDVTVNAPDATGALFEGTKDILVADSEYTITGDKATAINAHIDWMGNVPSNVTITGLNINIDTTGDADVLYFGAADTVTVTDNTIKANHGGPINVNATPNTKITDNYILVGEMLDGIFGNYAVETTEDDTIVENNTPVSKIIDDLNERIEELENKTAELENKTAELEKENQELQDKLDELEQKLKELEEKLAQLEKENKEQQDKIDEQQKTIDEQQEKINEQDDKIKELEEQLAQQNKPKNTTITIDPVKDAKFNGNVKISGLLVTEDGLTLTGQTVTLKVNGKDVQVQTLNGVFEYTTKFTTLGEQTITATYPGNDKYAASNATTTFTVAKQDIKITIDPIKDAAFGDNVIITGTVTDNDGNPIYNTNMVVKVNGKAYVAKTDKDGKYTLSAPTNKLGTNDVEVSYAGNTYYNKASTTTTFNTGKQTINITIDPVKRVAYGEKTTVTGKVTDKNGNPIYNTNIVVKVNGKTYTAKTDKDGKYSLEVEVTATNNKVEVNYAGNNYYESATTTTNFTATKSAINIKINPIQDTKFNGKAVITGTVTDNEGNAIYNTNIAVKVNGKAYAVKTDKDGKFTTTQTATLLGTNNVEVSYGGNDYFLAANSTATFNAAKQDIIVTISDSVKVSGTTGTITGTVKDADSNPLYNTNVAVTVNGKVTAIKTDANGAFTLNSNVITGSNTITVTYGGNNYYNSVKTTKTIKI